MPGVIPFGIVIVPSAFITGVGLPGTIGDTTTLVIVSVPVVTELTLPSGFTKSSLSKILGVVCVLVPVTTKLSGLTTGAGCSTVTVITPVVQLVIPIGKLHTS